MTTPFTSSTLNSLYNDDFSEDKGFHQILFNDGRALQARELTQLQTLIYEELGRFGRNIFKEGAAVSSGGTSINSAYEFVRIASTNEGQAFADIPVGTILLNPLTNVEARVLSVHPISTDFEQNTLYVQYTSTGAADVTSVATRFGDAETLYDQSGNNYELVTDIPNATGTGVRFDVFNGDFFVSGRFVHTNAQSIILSPYTDTVDAVVGFKVVEEVVTVNDDISLYDNAGGLINTASPGGDRYKITLQLTTQDKVTSDDTFVFIARVENSKIVEEIEETDAFNKINDLLALRTNEESGDYVVNPFSIHFDNVTDSALDLIISSGTAYVNGYRVDNPSPIRLQIPKPVATESITNDVVPAVYGNYFEVDAVRGLPDLDYSTVNLRTATAHGGSTIGSARIRAVEKYQDTYRAYVFDIQVDSDQSISSVQSIGTSGTDYLNVSGTLNQTTDNDLLFPTSRPRPETFDDITMVVQDRESQTTDGSGALNLTQLPVGETYTDTSLWLVASTGETFQTFAPIPSNGFRDMELTGLTPSTTYEIMFYKQITATRRAKTLTTTSTTFARQTATDVNGNAYFYYDLGVPDIYQLDSARIAGVSLGDSADILSSVSLDDGQRDNYYADGRIIFGIQDSAPATLYASFQHFTRGAGDFYDATSYDLPYADIPVHVKQNGTEVKLFNYLDFRPDKNAGTFSNINLLPRNGTNITADIAYYLPRADKLLVTQEGDFQVLMGQQSESPQYKKTPENSLELYKILLNANTLNTEDMQVTPIEHKSYTMQDIAKIEAKLDKLEEYTTLKFLELEQRPSLDSAGVERIVSGLLADDFSDQSASDVTISDYRASLDPESKVIKPMADENNIRLIYDASSTGVSKVGDQVTLNYDSEEWQFQNLASRFVNVNPFGAVDNVGTLRLSPSSDEWKESKEEAESAINGANKLAKSQAMLWNNWSWNWGGRSSEDIQLNPEYYTDEDAKSPRRKVLSENEKYFSSKSSIGRRASGGKFVSRVVSDETLRKIANGRVVDTAVVPWMRSRKIYFHAKGLKPNSKFTPFFDGENVSVWCREESSFVQYADRTDDQGNLNRQSSITAHPDGTSELISDDNGEVIGSFFIPNIRPKYYADNTYKKRKVKEVYTRFRTGTREFKLLDIDNNDWAAAGSKAFAYYTAEGNIDRRHRNTLFTRKPKTVSPIANIRRRPRIYTPLQEKNVLNNIRADGVNLTDPRASGRYSPETTSINTSGLVLLDQQGQMSTVLSDYIDVDKNQYLVPSVLNNPQNPMTQTFTVDNQYGLVLTKLDLFFRQKDSGNLPVAIHLRPVEEGKPSSTTIVPDSHVWLNPSQVTAIGLDPQLSTIQANPTTFTFDEPVFLQPWTTYAIVVTSQSTEYELFSAKTKETVYGSTSRTVTTQPAPGGLYLPQSGRNWVESKDQDLMYRLTRAKFGLGGGSLIMKNAPLPEELLDENPIRTVSGSSEVYIRNRCHGLEVGDSITLGGAVDTNGITAVQLNDPTHTVTATDLHGFKFNTAGSASVSGFGGGESVTTTRNTVFSTMNPVIESTIPNKTSIDVGAKLTSGKYISGSNTRYVRDETYRRITPNQNADFIKPYAIYNSVAETANLGAGVSSAYIKVDLKTASDYVSPLIDLQRASLVLAGYCMDNPTLTPHIYPVDETTPYGGTTGAKHITTPVTLEEPAVGIDANFKVNLPDGADIKMYYRTASSDENIYDKRWIQQLPESTIPNDNDFTLRNAQFLAGGRGGFLEPFNQSQIKLVGFGRDLPFTIKDLAIKFLAV